MKTLKDFYIVVTKQNHEQITNLLRPSFEFGLGKFIHFDFDYVDSWCINQYTKNKERISLSKLKRYIDNTPTREGLKKAQNASKIYKYKYEQERNEKDKYKSFLDVSETNNKELKEDYNQVKNACTALGYKLTERTNHLKEIRDTLWSIEELVIPEVCEQESTVIDWVNDVIKERDKWKGLHYNSSTKLDLLSDDYSDLKHSNERLQYNLDNLRSEREQLTNLAKKDVNLGKKTLVEWVSELYNVCLDYDRLNSEKVDLESELRVKERVNNELIKDNTILEKELRKYKTVAMCSLLLTLLALGLWF